MVKATLRLRRRMPPWFCGVPGVPPQSCGTANRILLYSNPSQFCKSFAIYKDCFFTFVLGLCEYRCNARHYWCIFLANFNRKWLPSDTTINGYPPQLKILWCLFPSLIVKYGRNVNVLKSGPNKKCVTRLQQMMKQYFI